MPILLGIAGLATLGVFVWALLELVKTARSVHALSEETRDRLMPLLEKADVTIDATNAELLRIDAAITRFEDVSVRVSAASGTLTDIVQHPAEVVSGVADRVRRAWKDRRRHAQPAPEGADEQPEASCGQQPDHES